MKSAPEHRLLRRVATQFSAALVALTFSVSAAAGIKSDRQLAAILTRTPAPQIVGEGQQMKLADQAAAAVPGAQTFWGIGQSMQPLYTPNTALVVKPIAYDDIKKGMTLVYVKGNGHVVAHSVIGEDGKGYIVQGVNNDEADPESVNEKNLIGVVVAAYSAQDSELRVELAKALVAKGKISRQVARI